MKKVLSLNKQTVLSIVIFFTLSITLGLGFSAINFFFQKDVPVHTMYIMNGRCGKIDGALTLDTIGGPVPPMECGDGNQIKFGIGVALLGEQDWVVVTAVEDKSSYGFNVTSNLNGVRCQPMFKFKGGWHWECPFEGGNLQINTHE